VNCWVCPCAVVMAAGVMASAAETVTTVEVTWPLPSVADAVIAQEPVVAGVLYKPVVAPIDPQVAVQVAVTLEVNCCCVPAGNVGLSGEMVSADAAPMVSTAVAVYAVPLDAMALMVQALPGVADAVNRPAVLMLPQVADQLTAVFAENCCFCPCAVTALAGEIVIGDVTLANVDVEPLPLVAVAVMVHEPGASGAVKRPEVEMEPQEALNVEGMLAVNCWVAPSLTVGFSGLRVNVVDPGATMVS